MGEPFDMKQKHCKSIVCGTHFVNLTLNFQGQILN